MSRQHWEERCRLEKERLERIANGEDHDADVDPNAASPHRVAGMRATEGWQYASMLADAWGCSTEISAPLEEMPTLEPVWADSLAHEMEFGNLQGYGDAYGGYKSVHPAYFSGHSSLRGSNTPRGSPKMGESSKLGHGYGGSPSASIESLSQSSHTHSAPSHSHGGGVVVPSPLARTLPLPLASPVPTIPAVIRPMGSASRLARTSGSGLRAVVSVS